MRRTRFAVPLLALLLAGCGYNRIQTLDEQVNGFESQIKVQLQRRADLIPNLVETVRGYASHEERVFTEVTEARSRVGSAIQSGDLTQMAAANQGLTGALSRLIAVSEAYPQLKANENFKALQDQLEGTENRISTARQDYNTSVQTYNSYIRTFPQMITAKVTGKKPRAYFDLTTPGAAEAPHVNFGTPAPAARDTGKH
jgi:LemA protein